MELRERKGAELLAFLLRVQHGLAGDLVGLAKGDPLGDEVIGKFGGVDIVLGGGLLHFLFVYFYLCKEDSHDPQRGRHRVDGIKRRLLVLLQIPVVCQGEGLEYGEDADQVTIDPSGLGPDQLQHVGVRLLGHDAAAGAKALV